MLAPVPVTAKADRHAQTRRMVRASSGRAALALAGAVIAGVALGCATKVLQARLTGSSAVLANSGAVWALVAFGLGLVMPSLRSAAVGGASSLVAASLSYYLAVDGLATFGSAPRGPVVWSIVGIAAGSTFGFAGYVARRSRQHRLSAWALVSGVLIGEGIHLTWYVGNNALRPAGIAQLGVAAIIATVSLRRPRSARLVVPINSAVALATLLALQVINAVFAAR